MVKGFITINIPVACISCPLCYKSEMIHIGEFKYQQLYRCGKEPDDIEDGVLNNILYEKPSWCPIKPVPEKQTRDYPEYDKYITGYDDGWDDCLEEILGE